MGVEFLNISLEPPTCQKAESHENAPGFEGYSMAIPNRSLGNPLLSTAAGKTSPEKIELDTAFSEVLDGRMEEGDVREETEVDVASGETPTESAPAGILELQENRPRYFELVSGTSRKFWEVVLSGDRYSVRFGRIGTPGQECVKSFSSGDGARRAAERMISEKIAKGYEEKPRPEKDS